MPHTQFLGVTWLLAEKWFKRTVGPIYIFGVPRVHRLTLSMYLISSLHAMPYPTDGSSAPWDVNCQRMQTLLSFWRKVVSLFATIRYLANALKIQRCTKRRTCFAKQQPGRNFTQPRAQLLVKLSTCIAQISVERLNHASF